MLVRTLGENGLEEELAEKGAEAILNLAASSDLAGRTGRYFNGLREARADPQAYDAAARRRLKVISLELTGAPPA